MHSTRVATFLLGLWLGASLLLDWGTMQGLDHRDAILHSPAPGAAETIRNTGADRAALLLNHFLAEQQRFVVQDWEALEIPIGLGLAAMLWFATERRPLPLIFCGLMLALVLVQYLAITPELTYRGREADFPKAGPAEDGGVRGIPPADGTGTLTLLFAFTEAVKLVVGAVLASYLFYFRSRKRKRKDDDIEEIAKAATLRAGHSPP